MQEGKKEGVPWGALQSEIRPESTGPRGARVLPWSPVAERGERGPYDQELSDGRFFERIIPLFGHRFLFPRPYFKEIACHRSSFRGRGRWGGGTPRCSGFSFSLPDNERSSSFCLLVELRFFALFPSF